MLKIVKVAAVDVDLAAVDRVLVVETPAPDRGHARGLEAGCRTRRPGRIGAATTAGHAAATASAAAPAATPAENILGRKVLLIDIIPLTKNGDLVVAPEPVQIHALIVILICPVPAYELAEIAFSHILFGNDIDRLDPVAVVKPGELALVAEIVENLDLIDH